MPVLTHKVERYLDIFFFVFLLLVPFCIGPTGRYALTLFVIGASVVLMKKRRPALPLTSLLNFLPFWGLLVWNVCALFSILFSPEPIYSLRVYFSEFFLNSILFLGLSLAVAVYKSCPVRWKRSIKLANIVFLSFYLGLLFLWLILPNHFLLGDEEHIRHFIADRMDIIFEYGRACELFHGVSHTSVFLALMIAYWSIFPGKSLFENGLFIFLNFLTLFTTTRRGALIASVIGFLFSIRLSGKKGISITLLLAIILATVALFMFYSGVAHHFIREDWHLIAQGRIEKAKRLGGSIPLRVSTYKEFSKKIMSNPFMPRGLGRKLIEEHWKGLVEKAGLQHGHNTLLNQAFYMGIQGALSLLIIIGGQFFLFLRALRMSASEEDQHLMMVTLVFMVIFWGINLFSDAFRHGSANLYWLITGLATGRAIFITKVALVDSASKQGS